MRCQLTSAGFALVVGVSVWTPQPSPGGPAQTIVPTPVSVDTAGGGEFRVTAATAIVVPQGNERVAMVGRYLSELIGRAAGPEPPTVIADSASNRSGAIHLALSRVDAAGDEGYELTVTADRVTITANAVAGLFYGVQTFRQLLPPFVDYEAVRSDKALSVWAPGVRVTDHPRFAWRGAMLDVARHFFSVQDVKRYVDFWRSTS